jgi:hypothetical protein
MNITSPINITRSRQICVAVGTSKTKTEWTETVYKITIILIPKGLKIMSYFSRYLSGGKKYIYTEFIYKSLRDFRTRLRNNQDRHGRKEHINRHRISSSFFCTRHRGVLAGFTVRGAVVTKHGVDREYLSGLCPGICQNLTSVASPRVHISSTCKVWQKLGVSLPLLTCSPAAWPSRLLYCRGQKSRRDLWITLYIRTREFRWNYYTYLYIHKRYTRGKCMITSCNHCEHEPICVT